MCGTRVIIHYCHVAWDRWTYTEDPLFYLAKKKKKKTLLLLLLLLIKSSQSNNSIKSNVIWLLGIGLGWVRLNFKTMMDWVGNFLV